MYVRLYVAGVQYFMAMALQLVVRFGSFLFLSPHHPDGLYVNLGACKLDLWVVEIVQS